ncbi:MAG: TerC family protein [Candidatus Gracilibacteria bacterium]|nr:TerC family protein [Candidatus Gracilibacteria bacterium]MDD3120257.1 TerC family protein [Candidatus Gracilibacteria bacterium]MDD4530008.1 TerC family protein [Candidatus Gracilibacteria bacterium]
MNSLINEFWGLFTPIGLISVFNIIMIDIVMSGDNAILIGMATKNLHGKDRKKAIAFGIILATILRIILAVFAVYLLQIVGLQLVGALLLIYIVWKFYKELRSEEKHQEEIKGREGKGLMYAIYTIIVADFSMSLDNVLAVSGASHGNFVALGIGLVFSILLMAIASNFIAKSLDKYPQIQWLGLFVILFVAMEMLVKGGEQLGSEVFHFNILPIVTFLVGMAFIILHQTYIKPISEEKIKTWLIINYAKILLVNLTVILILVVFGGEINKYLFSHIPILYAIFTIILFMILEIVLILRNKK